MSILVVALAAGAPTAMASAPVAPPPAGPGSTTLTTAAAPATATTTTVAHQTPTTARVSPTPSLVATTTLPPVAGPISPALLAIANSIKRTPPSNTGALLAALAPLEKLGFTEQQAAMGGMGQFPVAGRASYSDDWLVYRPGPPPELHQGVDIVAALGTPLRSPIDGIVTYDNNDPRGYGLEAVVTGADKTFYRMAHMSAIVAQVASSSPDNNGQPSQPSQPSQPGQSGRKGQKAPIAGLPSGSAVTQGQVIGFVGQTGAATGPHCHFEIHPQGGAGIDAKPILDGWQAAAIAAAPTLIAAVKGESATTLATLPPVAIVLPLPQTEPIQGVEAIRRVARRTPSGLALIALLALLASAGGAARRYRSSLTMLPKRGGT